MKKKNQLKMEMRTTVRGVTDAARLAGCTREHLSRVLHGKQRAGKLLVKTLSRIGITTAVDGQPL